MIPLDLLTKLRDQKSQDVEAWFAEQWRTLRPLPYFSCDVRHARFKMGVVDTNLFPAGFNNLCTSYTKSTIAALNTYFEQNFPTAKTIALVGENHTRNRFYLANVLKLATLINATGRVCHVTLPLEHFPKSVLEIPLSETETLIVHQPERQGANLVLAGATIDIILSNNDFSSGVPEFLVGVAQPIVPATELGWQTRTKSRHFELLNDIIKNFANHFDFDPWLLMPLSTTVSGVTEYNLAELADATDKLSAQIAAKYKEFGINETPYIYIKNDSGTYGLGVTSVANGDEVRNLNRKQRGKLFSAKGSNQTSRFLLQEGIPTHDSYSEMPMEPVIYGVGQNPVGGFFRLHEAKDNRESLNAPGMSFSCLCLHKLDEPHEAQFIDCCEKRELVAGAMLLARFAALAAAQEANQI